MVDAGLDVTFCDFMFALGLPIAITLSTRSLAAVLRVVIFGSTPSTAGVAFMEPVVSSTTNNSQVRRDIFDRPDTFDAEASLRDLAVDKRNLGLALGTRRK